MDFFVIHISMIDMIILSVVTLAVTVFCILLAGVYLKEKFNILLNKFKKGGQKK